MSTVKLPAVVMTVLAGCALLVFSLSAADEKKPAKAEKPAAAKAA